MTIRGHQIIGLKVYTLRQGKHVDKVEDVLFDPLTQKVAGFLVGPKRLLAESRAIPLTAVRHIGPDAVLVEDERSIRPDTELPARLAHLAKGSDQLVTSHIISQSGADLGYINDLVFDFPEGHIKSFVAAPKLSHNGQQPTVYISPSDIQTIGPDATIVSNYEIAQPQSSNQPQRTADNKQPTASSPQTLSQPGGFYAPTQPQPAVAGVLGGEASKTTSPGSAQASAVAERTSTPIDQNKIRHGEQVADLVAREREVSHAVGAYLTKNLISPIDDSLIAKRGDMVTYSLIDQAHQMGIDQQIFNFTSEQPINDGNETTSGSRESGPSRARKPLYPPAASSSENVSH